MTKLKKLPRSQSNAEIQAVDKMLEGACWNQSPRVCQSPGKENTGPTNSTSPGLAREVPSIDLGVCLGCVSRVIITVRVTCLVF